MNSTKLQRGSLATLYTVAAVAIYIAFTWALVTVCTPLTLHDDRINSANYEFLSFWQIVGLELVFFSLPLIGGALLYAVMRLRAVSALRVFIETVPLTAVYIAVTLYRNVTYVAAGPADNLTPALIASGIGALLAIALAALSAVFGRLMADWRQIRDAQTATPWRGWQAIVTTCGATGLAALVGFLGGGRALTVFGVSSGATEVLLLMALVLPGLFLVGAATRVAARLSEAPAGEAVGARVTQGMRAGATTSLIGAAFTIFGYFLPWARLMYGDPIFGCTATPANDAAPYACKDLYGADLIGFAESPPLQAMGWVILLALFLLTIGAWTSVRYLSRWHGVATVALAVLALAAMVGSWSVLSQLPSIGSQRIHLVSLEPGAGLTLIGLLIAIVGGLLVMSSTTQPHVD